MKSQERVRCAFHFEKPDKIPRLSISLKTDFFPFSLLTPKSFQPTSHPPHGYSKSFLVRTFVNRWKWKKKYRKIGGFSKDWWKLDAGEQLLTIDEWGVLWSSGGANRDITMGHPYIGPFQDGWEAMDDYDWPNPYDKTRYRYCHEILKLVTRSKYTMGIMGLYLLHNLPSWLRGFTNLMVDFRRYPNKVHELISRCKDFFLVEIELLKEKVPRLDAIWAFDDLGTQKSAFVSPDTFRKFFFKPYKELIDLTHDLGMDFILHSCGQLTELLPVFVDLGIDVMEFDSPRMTGVENFKKYAEEQKMAFWLSSNIQTTYSRGTPADIEEEVKYFVKEVGNNEGGMAFYLYADNKVLKVPKANILAYRNAMKKWGNYNEKGVIDWLA
jgi:hypothetical protein